MWWIKKTPNFLRIALFVLLPFLLSSCDGSGCVEADQFNEESSTVESNPVNDGVTGTYVEGVGGQIANWHDTGLLSSGEDFLIVIRGSWTGWYGNTGQISSGVLQGLPRCDFCAKKNSSSNCLCYKAPTQDPIRYRPEPEKGPDGAPIAVDCSIAANQNDQNKCTCTTLQGNATDYGVYHINLNYRNKNEIVKIPDEQETCKYEGGMGLYLGLFGSSGSQVPLRAYHLFSEEPVCDVVKNSQGQCLDNQGNDLTKYIFRSRDQKIFVKDDADGNSEEDPDAADNIYHTNNERVKLIINDGYYSDNYGSYQVTFLRGVAKSGGGICSAGVLECIVSLTEDVVIGEKVNATVVDKDGNPIKDSNGEDVTKVIREGGVVKFMYNSIIQDSKFILITQLILGLYITFYGLATLLGIAEINKKELLSRTMKIGLVMLFISPGSWQIYKDIIFQFFYDGMNYVMGFLLDLSDSQYSPTSGILMAQMDRAADSSQATRFSYIDTVIIRMFSDPVTKKIWGLFLGGGAFGILYIAGIYATIFFFLYVMATAAMIYTINLIKLLFALALGPLFFLFVFFQQTNDMFKKWLAFIGARSLEMIIMFLVLYNFILLIDKTFITMLSYRACYEQLNLGLFSLTFLKSYPERTFIAWVIIIGSIAGLTYLMSLIMDKVSSITESLIDISGSTGVNAGKGPGTGTAGLGSSTRMGNKLMDNFKDFAKNDLGDIAAKGMELGLRGGTSIARASGLSALSNKIGEKIPFRGVRSMLRDRAIDSSINKAMAAAKAKGLKGKAFDLEVRKQTMEALQNKMYRGGRIKGQFEAKANRMAMLGLDNGNLDPIINRLDQKLLHDRTKDFLKTKAKELRKSSLLIGKDFQDQLKKDALAWAASDLAAGADPIAKARIEKEIDEKFRKKYDYDTTEAAKRFAGNKDKENEYLRDLQKRRVEKQQGYKDSKISTGLLKAKDNAMRQDVDRLEKNFMRKAYWEKGRDSSFLEALGVNTQKGWNPLNRGRFTDSEGYEAGKEMYQAQLDQAVVNVVKEQGINIPVSGNISDALATQGIEINVGGEIVKAKSVDNIWIQEKDTSKEDKNAKAKEEEAKEKERREKDKETKLRYAKAIAEDLAKQVKKLEAKLEDLKRSGADNAEINAEINKIKEELHQTDQKRQSAESILSDIESEK